MVVIILGIIVLLAATVLKRSPQPSSRFGGIVRIAGAVIIGAGIISSAFKVIDPGMVGVQVLFGKVQDNSLESGLHMINPLVDVTEFDTRTQNYTMSATHNEGDVQGDDIAGTVKQGEDEFAWKAHRAPAVNTPENHSSLCRPRHKHIVLTVPREIEVPVLPNFRSVVEPHPIHRNAAPELWTYVPLRKHLGVLKQVI